MDNGWRRHSALLPTSQPGVRRARQRPNCARPRPPGVFSRTSAFTHSVRTSYPRPPIDNQIRKAGGGKRQWLETAFSAYADIPLGCSPTPGDPAGPNFCSSRHIRRRHRHLSSLWMRTSDIDWTSNDALQQSGCGAAGGARGRIFVEDGEEGSQISKESKGPRQPRCIARHGRSIEAPIKLSHHLNRCWQRGARDSKGLKSFCPQTQELWQNFEAVHVFMVEFAPSWFSSGTRPSAET